MVKKLSDILLKKNTIHAKILDFNLDSNKINLKVRLEYNDLDVQQLNNFQMIIKGRDYDDSYSYKPTEVQVFNEYSLSHFEVPFSLFNVSYNEIWDFYLNFNIDNKEHFIRIKNFLIDNLEKNYFRISNNVTLDIYTTVKGNFSIKTIYNDISAYITEINHAENNQFLISGTIFGLETSKVKCIKLIFESRDLTVSFGTKIIVEEKNNVVEFQKLISLEQLGLDYSKNEYNLAIEVHYNEGDPSVVRKPILADYNNDFDDYELFVSDKSVMYKLLFNVNTRQRNVYIKLSNQSQKLEVTHLNIDEERIEIRGYINDNNNTTINGKFPVIIKRREHDEIINDEVVITNNEYSYVLDVKTLVEQNVLINGIWDLYLNFNGLEYRFASKDDGIENKRAIVSFPQVKLKTKDGEIKAVKPYYTLYDEISLLVRNYIVNKKIENIYFGRNYMQISGIASIQQPNENIVEQLSGTVKFNLPYGEKLELPVEMNLKKFGKSKVEFAYNIFIKMNKNEKKKIFENLHFDLLEVKVSLIDGYSTFYINAVPSFIVNKVEKLIKRDRRVNYLVDRIKLKLYYMMNKILPINHKLIVFQSTTGMNYSCNPRGIYEQLLEENQQYKTVWVVNNIQSKIPGNPKIVKQYSLKYYYYMARGKFFINNGNFPNFYVKRKQTIHIQTWHGTPLKKLGFDIDPSSPSYKENTSKQLMKRIARWDYLVAPNEYTGKILQRAYKFENKMLNIGYPRNDIFYKPDEIKLKHIKETKEYLNIPMNKKVILYAPTWRDNEFHQGLANEPYNFKFNLERFVEKFGDEYVLLVRLHPREAVRCQIKEYENVVYNVTNFDDIKLLYLISDILITDYSSVMFDFANTKKPIIFFAHDIERYSSTLRGFYFDLYEEAPGPIVTKEGELFEAIQNPERILEEYKEQYDMFYNKYCSWEDGNASKRIINQVINVAKREN